MPELWSEGIDELESFLYSVTDTGHVRTGAPPGYHDDSVIALALAVWRPSPRMRRVTLIKRCKSRRHAEWLLRRLYGR